MGGVQIRRTEFERNKRFAGNLTLTSPRSSNLAVQGIFAYSYVPLRLISFLGLLLSGFPFFTWCTRSFRSSGMASPSPVRDDHLPDFLLFGFLFLILGILGQYIAQIYEEVKARPNLHRSERDRI